MTNKDHQWQTVYRIQFCLHPEFESLIAKYFLIVFFLFSCHLQKIAASTSFLISFIRKQYKKGLNAEFANNKVIV